MNLIQQKILYVEKLGWIIKNTHTHFSSQVAESFLIEDQRKVFDTLSVEPVDSDANSPKAISEPVRSPVSLRPRSSSCLRRRSVRNYWYAVRRKLNSHVVGLFLRTSRSGKASIGA